MRLTETIQPLEKVSAFRHARSCALASEPGSCCVADVPLGDQRGQCRCLLAHAPPLAFDDQPPQPGMNRKAKHLLAGVGQPALTI